MDLLSIAIGIGLGVSLLFSEFLGIAGGGLVVPGYLALHLVEPVTMAVTIAAGLAAFIIVRTLGSFVIIYGRRRTVLMILAGYLTGMLARYLIYTSASGELGEHVVIGFIIPGLIAVWLDRRGIIESLCSLLTAAVATRLILILIFGSGLAA